MAAAVSLCLPRSPPPVRRRWRRYRSSRRSSRYWQRPSCPSTRHSVPLRPGPPSRPSTRRDHRSARSRRQFPSRSAGSRCLQSSLYSAKSGAPFDVLRGFPRPWTAPTPPSAGSGMGRVARRRRGNSAGPRPSRPHKRGTSLRPPAFQAEPRSRRPRPSPHAWRNSPAAMLMNSSIPLARDLRCLDCPTHTLPPGGEAHGRAWDLQYLRLGEPGCEQIVDAGTESRA